MTASSDGARPRTRSSRGWLDLLRANEEPEVLPGGGPRLSREERIAVVGPIQEFQLGENSEDASVKRLGS